LDIPLSPREDVVAWLGLTLVPGIPAAAQRTLLKSFGSPQEVLCAPHGQLAAAVANGHRIAQLLQRGPDAALVEATLRWLEGPGCHFIALGDASYPRALLEIPDPPSVIYAKGRLELLNATGVAIVGSRNATPQGARDAYAFAQTLSQAGLAIVSGLALGIDAAAHRGGLAAQGSSIAVMGTGPDAVYPKRNRDLADALAADGCLISEFAIGTPPERDNFPRRNRLISGLARGVLVVEAALGSGSLLTAKSALEQGRDVFAVPGSIHSPLTKGCHQLIKDGAKLVESANDVLVEIGISPPEGPDRPESAPRKADSLLTAMGYAPVTIDQMAEQTGLDAAKLAARLTRLEIEGRVAQLAGGWFQRVKKRVIE
jgi:DNA processing protein